jgi:hypothetical protein
VAEAKIKITADTSQATREIDKLNLALKGIETTTDLAGKALSAITGIAAGVATALGFAAAKLDDLADSADALGVGINQLKALSAAAAAAGVDSGQLEGSMRRLSANLGEAFLNNASSSAKALQRLGLDAGTLMNMPVDKQMTTIAQAIAGIESPAIRSAISMDLLGKGGERLIAAFKDPKALAEFNERLERMGLLISKTDVENINKLEGEVLKLKSTFEAFLQKTISALSPYIVDLIKRINQAIERTGGFEKVLLNVLDVVEAIAKGVAILAAIYIGGKLLSATKMVTSAVDDLWLAFFGPVGRIGAVIKLLVKAAAAVGLFGIGKQAIDSVSAMGDEFDKIRASLDASRADRSTPDAGPDNSGNAAAAAKQIAESIKNANTELLKKYQSETDILGLNKQQVEEHKLLEQLAVKAGVGIEKISQTERDRVKSAVELRITKEIEVAIDKQLTDLETERLGLGEIDKDQREIVLAIRKLEVEYGRQLNDVEKERLTNGIKETQNLREQAGIRDAINNYTREQTELEKINRGLSLQKTLGGGIAGGVTSKKEFDRDIEALTLLRDRKVILEEDYQRQREELTRQYNAKILDLELKRIETVLMAEKSGMAAVMSDKDKATLQAIGQQERQRAIVTERINFEKKSELEKTQFGIQQAATLFSALGAHNKKAFEAAKAFNIANAIMNTYTAASKALATYPMPFGAIAAAAAVAVGLAQVAQIRSQTYSGRALGGPVMGGKSYIVGESGPELFTPSTTGSITRNSDLQGGNTTNVNFTIVANDTTGFDQLLASRKGVIQQIISDAMLEKGRRSMI